MCICRFTRNRSFLGLIIGLPYLHSSRSELVELHPQSKASATAQSKLIRVCIKVLNKPPPQPLIQAVAAEVCYLSTQKIILLFYKLNRLCNNTIVVAYHISTST
jgi:hypothetical protein